MGSGYIIPLWADVMIEKNNNLTKIYWKTSQDVFSLH
jgi:hypothetical protein